MIDNLNILVSFDSSSKQKAIINENLSDLTEIVYLADAYDRKKAISNAGIIIAWNPNREFGNDEYELMNRARFMQLLSAGGDHLPFDLMPEGMLIAGNVGAYARPMAEHVMAMILALAKNLREGNEKLAKGDFDQFLMSKSVFGGVCTILGFGGIGKAVFRLIKPFGTKVYAINNSGKTSEDVDFIGTAADLPEILPSSDYIVISLPLSKHTRGLIGEKELAMMKANAILVNVARGEIIDEKALYEHLISHPEFKVGIDAWWVEPFRHGRFETHYPFLKLPNVLGSPHNSAMVPEAIEWATKEAVSNVRNYIETGSARGIFRRSDYV